MPPGLWAGGRVSEVVFLLYHEAEALEAPFLETGEGLPRYGAFWPPDVEGASAMWILSIAHQKCFRCTTKPLVLGGPHRPKVGLSFPNAQDPKVTESPTFLTQRSRSPVVSVDRESPPRDAACAQMLPVPQPGARETLAEGPLGLPHPWLQGPRLTQVLANPHTPYGLTAEPPEAGAAPDRHPALVSCCELAGVSLSLSELQV